jgi:hypothetical protein
MSIAAKALEANIEPFATHPTPILDPLQRESGLTQFDHPKSIGLEYAYANHDNPQTWRQMTMATSGDKSLGQWVDYVFDHPVMDPAWHLAQDAPQWEGTREQSARYTAETFERSGQLLARFSDAQLNQAFWFLVSNSSSEFMYALVDPALPLPFRLRALRSFVPVFEQIMAARCSPHLSHLDEREPNPLNSACYMWWDILPIHGRPEELERAEFDSEVLVVLRRLLSIPHDACRESALHGVSEWVIYYPQAAGIIEDFLSTTPNLRPELASYAERAKVGNVL